jgi:hypothetical protein
MKKYYHQPIDPDLRKQLQANLIRLPAHLRWRQKTNIQCDFCTADDTAWVFAASRTSDGRLVNCLRWVACDKCRDLIVANDFSALARRAVAGAGFKGDQVKNEGVIKAVFLAFHADAIEMEETGS